jgi:hypothetical protein
VLFGARATIAQCRPILYVENDRAEKSAALIAELTGLGYRLYWHEPPLFNPQNYLGEKRNVFGRVVSRMMVCVPDEKGIEVDNLEEVMDIRQDGEMFTREIERYSRYVERNPDDLMARLMVAHCSNLMQIDARPLLVENLRRDPNHKPTIAIKALHELQRGNYEEGWRDYELRFNSKCRGQFGGNRVHDVPRWNGEPTEKVMLIWAEQGFGDMIMFARFFDYVFTRAPNAILEVQPELYELFDQSRVSPCGLYRLGRTLPAYDLHCSLPSVPCVLHAGTEMIVIDQPYLIADEALADKWRQRNQARIGFCNAGSPRSERPYTRDIPAELIEPLWDRFGPFFVLNQQGQFESFADSAAAIASLDLVITVDTSIAHLAGAMGVPTWLLLSFDPDWRWSLHGDTTIWYPSVKIFRQPRFRDWASVIDEVAAALDKRMALDRAA